jgi:hypothetical protein
MDSSRLERRMSALYEELGSEGVGFGGGGFEERFIP